MTKVEKLIHMLLPIIKLRTGPMGMPEVPGRFVSLHLVWFGYHMSIMLTVSDAASIYD